MSLVTWQGKLLLTNGKLTIGPAAAECCCTETPTDCPTPEEIPSFWIQFTLPAACSSCCGTLSHTIELPWNVDRNNWSFNSSEWCGSVYLDIEVVCNVNIDGTVEFGLEFQVASRTGIASWQNPSRPYVFAATVSLPDNGVDCCGSGDTSVDVIITEVAP